MKKIYTVFSIHQLNQMIKDIKKNRPNEKGTHLTGVFAAQLVGYENRDGHEQAAHYELKTR